MLVKDSNGENVFTMERLKPMRRKINGTLKIFCLMGLKSFVLIQFKTTINMDINKKKSLMEKFMGNLININGRLRNAPKIPN
tara:strand:- start:566 stop:811 length:246 start_codon:yes stop_codon:yes gene_type:complete